MTLRIFSWADWLRFFTVQSQCERMGGMANFQIHISQDKITKQMNKMRLEPNQRNKSPKTNPKLTKRYELPDKEFKIVLKKINILQENTDTKLNEIRKIKHKLSENNYTG